MPLEKITTIILYRYTSNNRNIRWKKKIITINIAREIYQENFCRAYTFVIPGTISACKGLCFINSPSTTMWLSCDNGSKRNALTGIISTLGTVKWLPDDRPNKNCNKINKHSMSYESRCYKHVH